MPPLLSLSLSLAAHNFKTVRGFEPCLSPSTVGIVLDYYWLQSSYYNTAYGTDWLSEKVPLAFEACPRLRFFVLPFDKDSDDLITMVSESK